MRRAVPFVLVSFIFAVLSVAAYGQSRSVEVTANTSLLATPDAKGHPITQVQPGDRFELLDQRGLWLEVQNPKFKGWLYKSAVRFIPAPKTSEPLDNGPPAGYVRSPDVPTRFVPSPDKVVIKTLSPEKDQGYDVGYITLDTVSLRDAAGNSGKVVELLTQGDLVVLVDRNRTADWVNVIDLTSGKEGWVYISHLDVYFSKQTKAHLPAFDLKRSEDDRDPDVTIQNDTDRSLTLRVGSGTYTFGPHSGQTIEIPGGSYEFRAWVPGAFPFLGTQNFSKGFNYSWNFFIENSP